MTTYSAIANSEIAVGAPVTNSLMTKNRDNPLAIQENDVSAPTNAYATTAGTITSQGALATLNSVTATEIDAGAVGQSEVATNAIGQSELKDATGIVSNVGSSPARLTLPGGQYGFYPQTRASAADSLKEGIVSISASSGSAMSTSYITNISLSNEDASTTTYAQQRYFTASRPYDLGDGEVGRFIFVVIDNATKKVEMVYQATEAPWHYNGKTNIRGKLKADGKKYRQVRDMSGVPFSLEAAKNSPVMLAEYAAAFKAAPLVDELITQEICQKDMIDIPHPFLGNDLTGKTVVMLDPVSDLNHELSSLCAENSEFDLNGLLHDGYLTIGNSDIGRASPNGVLVPSFKWKNTIN